MDLFFDPTNHGQKLVVEGAFIQIADGAFEASLTMISDVKNLNK